MPTVACPFRSSQALIENRKGRLVRAFGRLKPGVSLDSGRADLALIAARMQKEYPDSYPAGSGFSASMEGLQTQLTQQVRPMLLVLLATAGLVLLIACANVANLVLARMMGASGSWRCARLSQRRHPLDFAWVARISRTTSRQRNWIK